MDPTKNRLVLSRKAVLEEQRTGELDVIEQAYENGEVLKGTVKKIMPYGAFVALNGIEGLLHISDVSWRKISKVEDVLQPEQVIDVKIKSLTEKSREFLSVIRTAFRIHGKLLSKTMKWMI